jgi:hypothetical protein
MSKSTNLLKGILALYLYSASSAFPGSNPPRATSHLRVGQTTADEESGVIQLGLVAGTGEPQKFKLTSPLFPTALPSQMKPLPINLWMIVDSSQLCVSHHVDDALTSQWATLRKRLPAGSLVSLASFTNSTLEIQVNQQPTTEMAELGEGALRCDPRTLSASYEKALTKLLDAKNRAPNLPVVAWVYTSGNIQLSDGVLRRLSQRNISLLVILYNAILTEELRPLVDDENAKTGADRIRLISYDEVDAERWPERWYEVRFTPPSEFTGGTIPFVATAVGPAGDLGSASGSVKGVGGGFGTIWDNWGRTAIRWVLVACLLLGFYQLLRYYRVRRCNQCKRRMRVGQPLCLFCETPGEAFLVGAFNARDRLKKDHLDVLPIVGSKLEIGTHRRSGLKMVRPLGARRQRFFQITRDDQGVEWPRYRLMPDGEGEVAVNGRIQSEARFLAPGDQIESQGWKFTFVSRGDAK